MKSLANSLALFALSAALLICSAPSASAVLVGPGPAPGGSTFTNTGGVSGTETLATWDFSGFTPSAFTELYYGVDQVNYGPLAAGIDGTLNPMAYIGASGTTATWRVDAPYTSAGGSGDPPDGSYPITLTLTVTGLGPSPWVDATSLGLPADVGAVADNSAGLDFTLNWEVTVDMSPNSIGVVPLNGPGGVPGPGGHTAFSFASGFYSVPEAGSFLCMTMVGCLVATKRRRSEQTHDA